MMHFSGFATLLLSCSLISFTATYAQKDQQIPYVDGASLIDKGIKAHDDGKYKLALSYYEQIPEGDTNYLRALYESSLSNISDSNFSKAIDIAQKAIALHSADKRQLLLNIGASLDYMGKDDAAMKMYDSVAVLYPHDNRPYFERAIIKYRAKDYKAAEKFLEQSLLINPLHFRSNFLLGSLYLTEGRLTESMLALSTSLLCTTEIEQARNPISFLAEIATQTDEMAEYYNNRSMENRDPAFDEIDEIIHAKLALDKGYQLQSDLDDNIFRQLQVMMEKLQYDSNDKNFAMQFYVPLFTQVYKNGQFEPFALHLFSDYGIKVVDKVAASRKGKSRIDEVKNVIYPYLNNIASTRILDYEARKKAPEKYHYYSEDNTMAAGVFSNKEEQKFAPGLVQFYQDQSLVAEGNYGANGKKDGPWKYYYVSGNLRLAEEYKDGKIVNEATSWTKNGIISRQVKFDSEGEDTETKEYSDGGVLASLAVRKGKDEYEYTFYYPSGAVRKKSTYLNDKLKDGKMTIYFENGAKQKELNYKNEKLDGSYISYFENGKIDEKIAYADDKLTGPYLSYFDNGQLAIEANYIDGYAQGMHTEYRYDGSLYYKKNYNKGKADGEVTYYNRAGKPYGTVVYKNDRIISSKFTKPDGSIVSGGSDNLYVNIYNEYGVLIRKVPIDEKNKVEGKASYFFPFGGLMEVTNFKNDMKDGVSTFYYQNGNSKISRQYKGDTLDGYYKYFSDYGSLQTEGWMKNDQSQGTWHNYFSNGTLSRDFYLLEGALNGPEKNYEVNGKLDYTVQYDNGLMTGLTQYDTTGKAVQQLNFDKGIGKYKLLHFNGTPGLECDVKYGKLNGAYTIHGGNKELLEKGVYVNGKNDGEFETYSYAGKLRMKGNYVDGERDKTWTIYTYDGKLESIYHYEKGDQEGVDSNFNGGILRSTVEYHNDDMQGKYTVYGDGGKVAAVLYYDLGALIGYSYEGSDGKLAPMQEVKNGVAHIQTTYANGAKALDWNFDKNVFQGMQKLYYSNGKLAEEVDYDKGYKMGVFNQFNPDGSKYYEATFKNDEKTGANKYYDNKGKLIFVVNFEYGQMHGKAQWTDAAGKTKNYWYYYGSLEQ
jgi:antitoxin component YwqK of YwqJK toxin-antitoxin module